MRRLALALILGAALVPAARAAEPATLTGFSVEAAGRQHELEQRFDALLDAANLRAWMEEMTAKPHHVGSAHGRVVAERMAELFESWGYQTRIETYEVLVPFPIERRVELVAPHAFTASLEEPAVEGDRTSSLSEDRLPGYNAYSADGDVTAELVYVNQGIPGDYEELERRGIDVRGRIVIARYGGSWRGIKPKVAYEHGAVGCILYSDPRDDGFFQGETWPEGPFRPEHGVQRGSVADMPLFPGDPLTPGRGATPEAERLALAEAPTLMKIPVLPISWADARPLLEAIEGPVAPESWRGALPLTYRLGPGPAKVRLKLSFDWSLRTARNVIALLPGAERPDEWVIRGNHHDAWVFGARDPVSGMVALMEEARAIRELTRSGWRPRRTLVYAGWDAEEPGLLGSTEWAEQHAAELREKAVAYINSDSNARGFLGAGGSHTLERAVNEAARAVADPQTGVSVLERLKARRHADGDDEAATRADVRLYPLGSGSDYTPFLQHLGIASLNLAFGGEASGGSYHSAYDSLDHYTRFGDPELAYGVALAKTAGRVTLRLAEAEVLPLSFAPVAEAVSGYVEELQAMERDRRQSAERRAALLDSRALELAADPAQPFVAPPRPERVPHLPFAALLDAGDRLQRAAAAYDAALARAAERGLALPAERRDELNRRLRGIERLLSREEGLPRRPWFRHFVYAPGFYTGYGVKTLPAVREAIEQDDWDEAREQIAATAAVLERFAGALEEAAPLLDR
jgi:N-acetylated-alpha-linked acidic dipeptidase